MKWCYLVGILLLGVSSCKARQDELQDITLDKSDVQAYYDRAIEDLRGKCKKTSDEKLITKVTEVLENLTICLEEHLPKIPAQLKLRDFSEGSSEKKICGPKSVDVQSCFKGVKEIMRECSPDDEKSMPNFVFDALKAVLDYICTDEEAFFQKAMNSMKCYNTLIHEVGDILNVCTKEFEQDKSFNELSYKTKEFQCKAIEILKSCYGNLIKKHCPESDLNELFSGLLGAVHSACD